LKLPLNIVEKDFFFFALQRSRLLCQIFRVVKYDNSNSMADSQLSLIL